MDPQPHEPLDYTRLAKLLGMLGSDHDGEIAAAGRAASRLVRAAGLDWHEVLRERVKHVPVVVRPPRATSPGDKIEACLAHPAGLNEWERNFIRSLRDFRGKFSAKQLATLDRLYAKCG